MVNGYFLYNTLFFIFSKSGIKRNDNLIILVIKVFQSIVVWYYDITRYNNCWKIDRSKISVWII